jgi:threonine dehydratase
MDAAEIFGGSFLNDVLKARERISDKIKKTPLDFSSTFSRITNNKIWIKEENLQKTGSFKVRGALNKLRSVDSANLVNGVVTASAGNHAQGVAFAAKAIGVNSTIFMPINTPSIKVEATKSYGGDPRLIGNSFDECYSRAVEYARDKNALFVHPFNDRMVMAGQGTIAMELTEDLDQIDLVIVPVGGGGLITGVAATLKRIKPHVKIVGVQAKGADSMYRSYKSGRLVASKDVNTFAEGIAVKRPDPEMYDLICELVDDFVTVSDDDIAFAILMLMERAKLIAEGAGAAALASILSGKIGVKNKNVVCVVSGGNIDLLTLDRVLEKGFQHSGRRVRIRVLLNDRPGELNKILTVIADTKGNVVSIDHERTNLDVSIGKAEVTMEIETSGPEHQKAIFNSLKSCGIRIQAL